jgi:hypothetical protein
LAAGLSLTSRRRSPTSPSRTGSRTPVLGQSLDELPPQTRRLLTALHAAVTAEAARLDIPVELVRFTRRQLRERLTFGDTQLKVHLARLVDLELLVVHRLETGGFVYELAWRGEGAHGQPFLVGLTHPDQPTPAASYDPGRSGQSEPWSVAGRGSVGRRSGPADGRFTQASARSHARLVLDRPASAEPADDANPVVVADAVAAGGGR